jgi:hypothetical protein
MRPGILTTDVIKAQIQRLLADCPELREDDEALVLSLESETDATELCTKLVRKLKDNEALGKGLNAYIKELRAREEMLVRRDMGLRAILLSIMDAGGLKSLPLSMATLIRGQHQHVILTEPDLLPEYYRRHPPWEPKKSEIKASLKAGEAVPGAVLSNPEPSLTIRTK